MHTFKRSQYGMMLALPFLLLLAAPAPALAQASTPINIGLKAISSDGKHGCTGAGVDSASCFATVYWTSGFYDGSGSATGTFVSGGVTQTATCSTSNVNSNGYANCTSSPISIGGNSCTVSFEGVAAFPAGAENGSIHGSASCVPITGTISASPNPCTISAGASTCSSTISWSTANTPSATVTINNGAQTFAGGTSGSQAAPWIPNGSVLFTLNDSNGNPLSTVNVTGACASGTTWNGSVCATPAPTATLTASPNPVAYDGRSTLTWSSTNATSCTAGGPWSNSNTLSGSGLTNPLTSATTFTFQCTGPGGTSPLASVTVNVNSPSAPTATLTASPNPVAYDGRSTLTWSSTNATSCTAGGPWSNSNTLSGSGLTNPLTSATTFTFQCTGPGGTSPLASVTVNVNSPSAPTATLTASPNPVAYDGRSTLTWSSTNATSCTAGGPWSNSGTLSGSGLTNPLTSATTFTFQCTGPGGTSPVASVTVNVGSAPVNGACASTHYSCTAGTSTNNVAGATSYTWTCQGSGGGTNASCSEAILPTAFLRALPNVITSGQSSTLSWSSTNATSCTSAGGFSTGGATSGSATVSPPTTSSYQIYCDNASGRTYSNIATVTVSPPPTVSISASPSRVLSGATVTISWSATNVSSCTITRNGVLWRSLTAGFSGSLSGSAGDTIASQTVYVMNCNNKSSGATATATQIVNVVQSFQEF